VRLDRRDHREQEESQVWLDHKELVVNVVELDHLAQQALFLNAEKEEKLVSLVVVVLQDLKDNQVLLAPEVNQDQEVNLDNLGLQVPVERLDLLDLVAHQDEQGPVDQAENEANLVHLEEEANLVQLDRVDQEEKQVCVI
jgi:hypothetical protein